MLNLLAIVMKEGGRNAQVHPEEAEGARKEEGEHREDHQRSCSSGTRAERHKGHQDEHEEHEAREETREVREKGVQQLERVDKLRAEDFGRAMDILAVEDVGIATEIVVGADDFFDREGQPSLELEEACAELLRIREHHEEEDRLDDTEDEDEEAASRRFGLKDFSVEIFVLEDGSMCDAAVVQASEEDSSEEKERRQESSSDHPTENVGHLPYLFFDDRLGRIDLFALDLLCKAEGDEE